MFTKQEILDRRRQEIFNAQARGERSDAGLNLAVLILGSALYGKKQWSGADYAEHPLLVGLRQTRSTAKQIIGILHDVVEDSDWTLDDLRAAGFSERIVAGVDGVTRRMAQGEKYLDFVERCSLNPDSIDIKINDLEHNSTHTRNAALLTDRNVAKQNIYIIAYNYLVAVKKREIRPGSPVQDFIALHPLLDPGQRVMEENSRRACSAGLWRAPGDYSPW